MKIREVSCGQFAGITDKSVSFGDGINVVFGANESGKSTLASLISRTLFQDVKVDKRSNAFAEACFPAAKRSGVSGDSIDGCVVLEAEDGCYRLHKEWGEEPRCRLTLPDNTKLSGKAQISQELARLLVYGEGVYSDMLFSSQSNADISLQSILDAASRTEAKQELADVVTAAFSGSGGISAEDLAEAVQAQLREVEGGHWNRERCAPERHPKGQQWSKERGRILDAYYAVEGAEHVVSRIRELEDEADRQSGIFAAADSELQSAERAVTEFGRIASRLTVVNERRKSAERLTADIAKLADIPERWGRSVKELEQAGRLRSEAHSRSVLDTRQSAGELIEKLHAVRESVISACCPTEEEIRAAKAAERRAAALRLRLCGMNITAMVKQLGSAQVEITSLLTGEPVDITEGSAAISEAVRITVPDVLEMVLAPADVDAEAINREISDNLAVSEELFSRFGAQTIEELEQRMRQLSEDKAAAQRLTDNLKLLLSSEQPEAAYIQLCEQAAAITEEVRSKADISSDIAELCGGSADSFISSRERTIAGFEEAYGSAAALTQLISEKEWELSQLRGDLHEADSIPEEYLSISSPEEYLENLRSVLDMKRGVRESAFRAKTEAVQAAESFKDSLTEDPSEALDNARSVLAETTELLNHWIHISETLEEIRAGIEDNPMQSLADGFLRNLGIISGGRITTEFTSRERPDMLIYSGDNRLDYSKLSEGTKETVSLAYRLAVLDELFPNGGGVILLDDPFTDMDIARVQQSCELLRDCAKRHQVIFLTCRDEYIPMLGGNVINF